MLRGARLRPVGVPPDRKTQPGRSRNFKNAHQILPGQKGAEQGNRAEPQEGRDTSSLPGSLTEEVRLGESPLHTRPSSVKGWSAPGGASGRRSGSSSSGRRGLCPAAFGSRSPGSMIPAVQAPDPGCRGTQLGSCTSPRTGGGGRAQDSEDAPAAGAPKLWSAPPPREHLGQCGLGDCGSYCGS